MNFAFAGLIGLLLTVAASVSAASDDATAAPVTITAHRALQMDRKDYTAKERGALLPVGSRKAASRGAVVAVRSMEDASSVSSDKFAIVFPGAGDAAAAKVLEQEPIGALFVVPSATTAQNGYTAASVEKALSTKAFNFPVLFARDGPNTTRFIAQLSDDASAFVVATSPTEPVPMATRSKLSYMTARVGPSQAARRVAIVAHADTLGAAPGLVAGYDAGSGATAWLELLKILSKSWTSKDMSITFFLGTAGRHSYQASRAWLHNYTKTSAPFDFVVCLESLAKEGALYVQEAKEVSEAAAGGAVGTLQTSFITALKAQMAASTAAAVPTVESVARRINVWHNELAFEHEVFANHDMPAVTVTGLKAPLPQARRSHVNDFVSTGVAPAVLAARIDAIAKAISAIAQKAAEPAAAVAAADVATISALAKTHEATPRPAVAFPAPLWAEYRRIASTAGAKSLSFKEVDFTPQDGVVYDTWTVELGVYRHGSTVLELAVTAGIIGYLVAFSVLIGGVERTRTMISGFFGSMKQ